MKHILTITLVTLCCSTLLAKGPQKPDSYNYQRGIELIQEDELEEGIDYLMKELANNPKNGYAQAWLASAYAQQDERGNAIAFLEEAQKNLPKAEKYYRAWSYSLRARLYLEMEDTTSALKAYTTAIKIQPTEEEWYEKRGMLYRDLKQWAASDADFQQYVNLTPGQIRGLLLLGNNLYLQARYEEALKKNQLAHQLAERSFTYSFMAECEIKLSQWEEAVNHIIHALEMEAYENTATEIIGSCHNAEFVELMQTALKAQIIKNPNADEWLMYQIYFLRSNRRYTDAINVAKKTREINPDAFLDAIIAGLYSKTGDWKNALHYINLAIEADSTDYDYLDTRADIYLELNDTAAMMRDINTIMERSSEKVDGYASRGAAYFLLGQYAQAIEDYDLVIAMNKDLTWPRYVRARCMSYLGDTVKAQRECERIVNDPKSNLTTRMMALIMTGQKDEALTIADSLMREDSLENCYNVACAHALMGNKERAMQLLEQSLKDGYVEFGHIAADPDLESLRGEKLDSLIDVFRQQCEERIRQFQSQQAEMAKEERVVEIPFTAANGVTKVDCSINGLPLNFVFDTGAADVTLSLTEANFMFKNGYLKAKDIVGKQAYQTADGTVAVGTVFILERINFGGLELTNVQASVVQNQKAPLLLGQTVLKRLGKIEIDNEKRIIRVTTGK